MASLKRCLHQGRVRGEPGRQAGRGGSWKRMEMMEKDGNDGNDGNDGKGWK